MRRIEAIATAKGVGPDQLADRLRLCFRVPRLAVPDAGSELGCHMGAVLQAIQGVCKTAECALLLVTHWNKTGDGRGADHISGAGPAAWARLICSVAILHRGSDPDGASTVLLGVELIGGKIADTRFRLRRRVRADDPANLGSPLSYAVEVLADDDPENLDPAAAALSKSRQWVLTALRAGGDLQTVKQLGDRLAQAGPATGRLSLPTTAPAGEWARPDPPGVSVTGRSAVRWLV